jgi:hypothetical protein
LVSKPVATVSGDLASKPVVMVYSGLASKHAVTVFTGLTSKPVLTVFGGFASKPAATVSSGLASKPGVTVSDGLTSKSTVMVFSSLASKLVAMVCPDLTSKPVVGFLVKTQNQDGGGFFGLVLKTGSFGLVIRPSKSSRRFLGFDLKTKWASVCRLRHKTDGGRSTRDTRRDLVACFAWKQVWLGFFSLT